MKYLFSYVINQSCSHPLPIVSSYLLLRNQGSILGGACCCSEPFLPIPSPSLLCQFTLFTKCHWNKSSFHFQCSERNSSRALFSSIQILFTSSVLMPPTPEKLQSFLKLRWMKYTRSSVPNFVEHWNADSYNCLTQGKIYPSLKRLLGFI